MITWISLPGGLFSAGAVVFALRDGAIGAGITYSRADQPFGYWANVVLFAISSAGLILLGLTSNGGWAGQRPFSKRRLGRRLLAHQPV